MNKTSIPDELRLGEKTATNMQEKVELFNEYFQSVYTPENPTKFELPSLSQSCEPILTNFSISKKIIRRILVETDVTKSRGPEGIPPVFFKELAEPMSQALHIIFKAIKRRRTIPDEWKVGAVSPIHKKGDKHLIENYRPVTLLNFASKVLERCMNEPLNNHFMNFVTESQHGFIKNKSVLTNLIRYLRYVH